MALSNTYNFGVKQGDDFTVEFSIQNADLTPFDLTGYSARLHVRKSFGSTTVLINSSSLGVTPSLIITDPLTGVIYWNVSSTETAAIKIQGDEETIDLVYDLEVVSSTGKVLTPARGTITLYHEVTR
jgi:hypothetical protein